MAVVFEHTTRKITITTAPVGGVVALDVQKELYSEGKRQWKSSDDLNKLAFCWKVTGGDLLASGDTTPRVFTLLSPWTITPHSSDHTLVLTGNIFSEVTPMIDAVVGYTILADIRYDVGLGSKDPDIATILTTVTQEEDDLALILRKVKENNALILAGRRSGREGHY